MRKEEVDGIMGYVVSGELWDMIGSVVNYRQVAPMTPPAGIRLTCLYCYTILPSFHYSCNYTISIAIHYLC